jgi:hypothetical protein
MRILLKLVIDCEPDVAWRALHSTAVFSAVSFPLVAFESLEPEGFPDQWPGGRHLMQAKAFGLVPVGEQTVDIADTARKDGTRIVVDTGRGLTGPLALVTGWHHSMAVAPAPGGRTLYRDELRFGAGPLTLLLWPVFWAFWQWRAFGIRRLAPGWK